MNKAYIILSLIAISVVTADFSSSAYQAQNRTQKLQQLQKSIFADTLSGSFPTGMDKFKLFTMDVKVTMNYLSDEFPEGRKKLIHSVGNTATCQFIANNNSYTGLFQGADSAIIRLSAAKKPDFSKNTAAGALDNFTPGFGLKFLIDGQPSANTVAMFGVNGAESWNFFGKDFSNHIGEAKGNQLAFLNQKFSQATDSTQTVGLKEFAAYTQKGEKVDSPKFPWRLIFRAPEELKSKYTDKLQDTYLFQLMDIPSDSILYDVYAIESPTQACEQKIGQIKLTSKLTTSKFGDETLFFQHQKMENDLEFHPENKDYTPFWSMFSRYRSAKKPEGKCPYA